MSYTVSEVAKAAGVTVRTLHHYDEVGLLRPSGRSAAGYRQYDDLDLERLQEVLLYRELGFGLDEIAGLVDIPTFNRIQILGRQRQLIEQRIDRLRSMAKAVDEALQAHEEGRTMNTAEMFGAFGDFEPAAYEEEVRARWGETEAYAESSHRTASYTKNDWKRMRDEGGEINQRLADLFAAGMDPEAEECMDTAEQHRLHIDRWFYPCSHEMHTGLGEMYVADPRFAKFWDEYQPGLALFVREAFLANGLRAAA
jgi:DNA-binding transcriptional MerR regulator